jgi:hypothetical protein
MTEAEWLACANPRPILEFLRNTTAARRFRLFACGCCREIWRFLPDERSRQAVEAAELFADGRATQAELTAARVAAEAASGAAEARVNDAMRAMNYGDYTWFADRSAERFAARAAVGATAAHAWEAASAVSDDGIKTATAQCVPHLEAAWWGWDRPEAEAEWSAAEVAARQTQCSLIRDLFGNPFRPPRIDPTLLTPRVVTAAEAIYEERTLNRLPILAGALEEAGCSDADILRHCRHPGGHALGCWVVDLVLGKG